MQTFNDELRAFIQQALDPDVPVRLNCSISHAGQRLLSMRARGGDPVTTPIAAVLVIPEGEFSKEDTAVLPKPELVPITVLATPAGALQNAERRSKFRRLEIILHQHALSVFVEEGRRIKVRIRREFEAEFQALVVFWIRELMMDGVLRTPLISAAQRQVADGYSASWQYEEVVWDQVFPMNSGEYLTERASVEDPTLLRQYVVFAFACIPR